MKRLLLSALLMMMAFSQMAFANHDRTSILNLRLYDDRPFTVQLDGYSFNQPDNHFSIAEIEPGSHHLMVFREWPRYGWGGFKQVLYNGTIHICGNSEISAVIGHHRDMQIERIVALHTPQPPVPAPGWCGTVPANDYGHNGYHEPYGHHSSHYTPVMSHQEFDGLMHQVRHASFESSKLTIAKQALHSNYINARQLRSLLDEMTYESSKLELAKYAYDSVVDTENYYLINDAFTYSSSISEMSRFTALR